MLAVHADHDRGLFFLVVNDHPPMDGAFPDALHAFAAGPGADPTMHTLAIWIIDTSMKPDPVARKQMADLDKLHHNHTIVLVTDRPAARLVMTAIAWLSPSRDGFTRKVCKSFEEARDYAVTRTVFSAADLDEVYADVTRRAQP